MPCQRSADSYQGLPACGAQHAARSRALRSSARLPRERAWAEGKPSHFPLGSIPHHQHRPPPQAPSSRWHPPPTAHQPQPTSHSPPPSTPQHPPAPPSAHLVGLPPAPAPCCTCAPAASAPLPPACRSGGRPPAPWPPAPPPPPPRAAACGGALENGGGWLVDGRRGSGEAMGGSPLGNGVHGWAGGRAGG